MRVSARVRVRVRVRIIRPLWVRVRFIRPLCSLSCHVRVRARVRVRIIRIRVRVRVGVRVRVRVRVRDGVRVRVRVRVRTARRVRPPVRRDEPRWQDQQRQHMNERTQWHDTSRHRSVTALSVSRLRGLQQQGLLSSDLLRVAAWVAVGLCLGVAVSLLSWCGLLTMGERTTGERGQMERTNGKDKYFPRFWEACLR